MNEAFKAIIDSKKPYVATGGSIIKDVARKDAMIFDRKEGGDLSWTGFKWNEGNSRVNGTED